MAAESLGVNDSCQRHWAAIILTVSEPELESRADNRRQLRPGGVSSFVQQPFRDQYYKPFLPLLTATLESLCGYKLAWCISIACLNGPAPFVVVDGAG